MKVWYVSYGSNMNYNRFLTYISGGKVNGSNKVESGARNNTLPTRKEVFKLNRNLKFLMHSSRWDSSVLFLGDVGSSNYAVRYLIEDEQFIDVLKQENNLGLNKDINLTVKELMNGTSKDVFDNSWYSTLFYLGEYDGYKAYTFSCNQESFSNEGVKTGIRYLSVILNGINQFDGVDIFDVISTFLEIDGVKDMYSFDDLKRLIR